MVYALHGQQDAAAVAAALKLTAGSVRSMRSPSAIRRSSFHTDPTGRWTA